jgi:hypothetical protein
MELGERVFNVAVPHMPGGVTVVGATFWPDGRFDVSVDIFALPVGTFWDPNSAHVPTGRIARALALATRLFRGGASLDDASDFDIQEIAHAKWIDPVLGALAFHAHEERLAKRESTGTPLRTFRDTIRHNLSQHFPQLPDSRIIAALHDDKDARRSALLALLEEPGFPQPVLTASLAYLVRAALEAGRESHWAIERFDRVSPGQVFNAIRTK